MDRCEVCKGIYLDDGELRDLTGDRSLAKWLIRHARSGDHSRLTCPGCGEGMESLQPGKVQVEVCTDCHGIWLDWSELEMLGQVTQEDLERSELEMEDMGRLFEPPDEGDDHPGPVSLLQRLGHKFHRGE